MAAFISVWKTDNLSEDSSEADQVSLPLVSGGTNNFVVDWGDGTQDTITSWDQPEKTHTYAAPGTYTITIDGAMPGFRFNHPQLLFRDNLKIVLVEQWGDLLLNQSGFDGCSNLDCSDDSPVMLGGTAPFACFRACRALTKVNVSGWDLSAAGQINSTFDGCRSLEQIIGLETWDVSEITHMLTAFRGCHVLALRGIEHWNTSSVINLNFLFNATARDLDDTAFPDISRWDVRNVTGWNNTFVGSNNSVENYDNILINWSQLPLQPGREVNFPWTRSPISQAAYDRMVNEHGWTINDNGLSETPINLSAPSIPDEGGADIPITVTPGAWDDRDNGELVLHYQWTVSDDDTATGETNIEGATGPTYTPLPEHVGKYIRVWERGENDGRWDPAEDTPSNFLAVVPAPENLTAPTLQINPDGTWTGGLGTWSDSPTNYDWELRRAVDDSVVDSGATSDAGAVLSGLLVVSGEYVLKVIASNIGGHTEALSSPETLGPRGYQLTYSSVSTSPSLTHSSVSTSPSLIGRVSIG